MAAYFIDYEELVIKDYHQKKEENRLPLNLSQPTPARLKEECLRVCRVRFLKKDEPVILDFFGKGGDQKECLQVIELCKIGKFKPLLNFLNGDTTKTDEKNILLLAWLIDYSDRPFDPRKNYQAPGWPRNKPKEENDIPGKTVDLLKRPVVQENEPITGSEADDPSGQVEPSEGFERNEAVLGTGAIAVSEKALPQWKYRKLFLVALLLLSGGGAGLFWWWDNRQSAVMSAYYSGGCMYWAGDHYQPVPCNEKISNTLVVALDTAKVNNFKKITDWQRITRASIGTVWYSKIDGNIEFFTAEGYHPIELKHRLKRLSEYMYNKHVQPKEAAK